jgi:hypothetical protein
MVGSNEFENAWMDEGINNYTTARLMEQVFPQNRAEARFFGGFIPWTLDAVPFTRLDNDRLPGYRDNAEADVPATPTWRYWPSTATGHHLQQDVAVAAHARAAPRLADDAPGAGHLFRTMAVQAPEARGFLRGGA